MRGSVTIRYNYVSHEMETTMKWSRTNLCIIASCCAVLASCSESPSPQQAIADSMPVISGDAVFAHVALLADDLYEGRETGKRGYQLAAKYVATQFAALGLEPGNNGSYFQTVTFATASVIPGSRALTVSSASGERSYKTFEEFTSGPSLGEEASGPTRARCGCCVPWVSASRRSTSNMPPVLLPQ